MRWRVVRAIPTAAKIGSASVLVVLGVLILSRSLAAAMTSKDLTVTPPAVVVSIQGGLAGASFGRVLDRVFQTFAPPTEIYSVKSGDTVCSVLRSKNYPPPCIHVVRALYAVNPGLEPNADKLIPGQEIKLPLFQITTYRATESFQPTDDNDRKRAAEILANRELEPTRKQQSPNAYFIEFDAYKLNIPTNGDQQSAQLSDNLADIPDIEVDVVRLNPLEDASTTAPSEPTNSPALGSVVVEIKGATATESASLLLKKVLNASSQTAAHVRTHAVQPGETLCIIYQRELNLPGCSNQTLELATALNPKVNLEQLNVGKEIVVPNVKLESFSYTIPIATNRTDPLSQRRQDILKKEFWQHYEFKDQRKEGANVTTVVLQGYRVELPFHSSDQAQSLLNTVSDADIPNTTAYVRSVESRKTKGRSLFSSDYVTPSESICTNGASAQPKEAAYWRMLPWLSDWEPPKCALTCLNGVRCPKVVLVDTPVIENPDLMGVVKSLKSPTETSAQCAKPLPQGTPAPRCVPFDERCHHGTSMAGIIGSKSNGSGFAALSQAASIDSFDWLSAEFEDLKEFIRARAFTDVSAEIGPQIFVFASKFPDSLNDHLQPATARTSEALSYAPKSLNSDRTALKPKTAHEDPRFDNALASALIESQVFWITAAGQRETPGKEPWELSASAPVTPMNLGDLRNVVVVTACDPCYGDKAAIWDKANFSGEFVHVAAPGLRIPGPASSQSYAIAGGGTSQATAFVASVAAGMISCHPGSYLEADDFNIIRNSLVKLQLQLTSRPIPTGDARRKVASGIVDPRAALNDPMLHWVVLRDRADDAPYYESTSSAKWCQTTLPYFDLTENTKRSVALARVQRIVSVDGATSQRDWFIQERPQKAHQFEKLELIGPVKFNDEIEARPLILFGDRTLSLAKITDLTLSLPKPVRDGIACGSETAGNVNSPRTRSE